MARPGRRCERVDSQFVYTLRSTHVALSTALTALRKGDAALKAARGDAGAAVATPVPNGPRKRRTARDMLATEGSGVFSEASSGAGVTLMLSRCGPMPRKSKRVAEQVCGRAAPPSPAHQCTMDYVQ